MDEHQKNFAKGGIRLSYDGETIQIEQRQYTPPAYLLTEQELIQRAKNAYPDNNAKVAVSTFSPDWDEITPEWILSKLASKKISRKELSGFLGLTISQLSRILTDKQGISRGVKASLFYFFALLEQQRSNQEETHRLQLSLTEQRLKYDASLDDHIRQVLERDLERMRQVKF